MQMISLMKLLQCFGITGIWIRQLTLLKKSTKLSFLKKNEQVIINLLKEGDTLSIDQIQQATQIPLSGVSSTITMLEIQGLVSKRTDGTYEAV